MANEEFDRWWNSSKYMQVVYSGAAERQIALDAWNARAALSSAAVAEREPVVAAWQFKHYDPISGHPVWKTTLYWNGHRATEYRPLYLDPPPTSELEALRKRVAELEKALEPFAKAGELFPGEDADFDQCIYRPAAGDEYALSGNHLRAARRVREGGKVGGE